MRSGPPRAPSPREQGEVEQPAPAGVRVRGRPGERRRDSSAPHPVTLTRDSTSPRRRGEEAAEPGIVLLGEFGRAQGLRGEVRLKSYTGDPSAIAGYGPLVGRDGRRIVIVGLRRAAGDAPDMLVVRVEGVTDRDAAEALNRMPLHVPRERLGEVADEDEFFLADLIGLAVENGAGLPVGRVVAVPNYGGGDLLEILPESGGSTLLLPFTKACVPVIDLPGGRVVANPPAAVEGEAPDEEPDERG